MFKKSILMAGVLCLAANPAWAKKFSITFDGSCESATFQTDKDFYSAGETELFSYSGTGTDLCANFYGVGTKVKATFFGLKSDWLLFSVHSTAPDLATWEYMIAIQYPIATGKAYIQNVVDGGSVHSAFHGSYTVKSSP